MKAYLRKIVVFLQDEAGASAIEYALLVALIALAITVGAAALGTQINTMFNSAAAKLKEAGG